MAHRCIMCAALVIGARGRDKIPFTGAIELSAGDSQTESVRLTSQTT